MPNRATSAHGWCTRAAWLRKTGPRDGLDLDSGDLAHLTVYPHGCHLGLLTFDMTAATPRNEWWAFRRLRGRPPGQPPWAFALTNGRQWIHLLEDDGAPVLTMMTRRGQSDRADSTASASLTVSRGTARMLSEAVFSQHRDLRRRGCRIRCATNVTCPASSPLGRMRAGQRFHYHRR